MYKNYCEKYPEPERKISERYYRVVFKKENIGFSRPSVDDCVECLIYEDHKTQIEQENTVQEHDKKLNAGQEQQHDKESCTLC